MTHITVIGAGITGVTSAYVLAKAGYQVTVIDKNRYPAMDTSFANGGQLSASNAEVWTHPSTIWKGLKWMFKADAPLLIHPSPSWHKLRWFTEFICAIPQYAHNTIATASLAIAAREYLFSWAQEEGIDFDLKQVGILHIYRTASDFKHAQQVTALLQKGGLVRQAVTPDEMRSIEPTLQGQYYGGFYTQSDSTGDIHRFTLGLSKACERLGVRFIFNSSVARLQLLQEGVRLHCEASQGAQSAPLQQSERFAHDSDKVVVCAGVYSRQLAAQVGDGLNIYPVKGYSITVHLGDEASQQAAPQVSLLDDATKLVTSRLGTERFRVAGTAEFNGYNYDIRADRIRPLVQWVNQCFPGVNTRQVTPWAGLRPMMPNMMPRVGQGKHPQVFYNTGHGHLGWTLSAITAVQLFEAITQGTGSRNPPRWAIKPQAAA